MNNFVFSGGQDPILFNSTIPQYQYNEPEIKKQLDTIMTQYHDLRQSIQDRKPETPQPPYPQPPYPQYTQQQEDHLGSLDDMIKGMGDDVLIELSNNAEFVQLNNWIQQLIQVEMMKSVKWSINNNPEAVGKIKQLKDIINICSKEKEKEERKNISEINDYIQNYSDMTFNEYKKLKSR